MGLFLQVIKCDNEKNNWLVLKYQREDITTGSRLIVGPSQEVVFVKGGEIYDILPSGSYSLSTENLPVLSALVNLPFGKKTPFTAEIFFVNKLHILDMFWGTQVPIQLTDPVYGIIIPVRAFGQYGISVRDAGLFIKKLSGANGKYTTENIAEYFRGLLNSRIVDILANFMVTEKIGFTELNAHIGKLSEMVKETFTSELVQYGLGLENFFTSSINVPEDDPSVVRLKKTLDKKNEMKMIDYTYKQEQGFEVLKQAASGMMGGESGGSLGTLGAQVAVGAVMGGTLGEAMNTTIKETLAPEPRRFCTGCGKELPAQAVFCTGCGQKQENGAFCPGCGHTVKQGARFCSICGAKTSETGG